MSKITIPAQGASGRIEARVMVKDSAGNIVPKEGASIKCSNIVTNLGLEALRPTRNTILELGALSNVVSIGTGSQAELGSVTSLAIPARKGTGSRTKLPLFRIPDFQGTGKPLAVQEYVVSVRYAPDGVARNYSEIGLGEPAALQTYTLFKNSETLVPETLTVLGDEYLDLTYYYQVQGLPVSGFTYGGGPGAADSSSALADIVDNQPLGPFPASGEGLEEGTEVYTLLFSRTSSDQAYQGIYYFNEPNPLWDPSSMIPSSEHIPNTSSNERYGGTLFYSWEATNIALPSGALYARRFPAERRPLSREVLLPLVGNKFVIAPGALTQDKDIYIAGYGHTSAGGIIMFTKPIRVTKDSRLELSANMGTMWDTLPPVNSTFVSNPGG